MKRVDNFETQQAAFDYAKDKRGGDEVKKWAREEFISGAAWMRKEIDKNE